MNFLRALFDDRLSTSAVPIALCVWLIQHWWTQRRQKLEETQLAVMYLNEISKEIDVGVERLSGLYCNGGRPKLNGTYHSKMPTACWNGMHDIIPDDIYRRICMVAAYEGKDESINNLRWHLKNYYTVICEYGNKLLLEESGVNSSFEMEVVRTHLNGARMVAELLEDTNKNDARKFEEKILAAMILKCATKNIL